MTKEDYEALKEYAEETGSDDAKTILKFFEKFGTTTLNAQALTERMDAVAKNHRQAGRHDIAAELEAWKESIELGIFSNALLVEEAPQ